MEPKRYYINNLPDEPSPAITNDLQKKRIDGLIQSITKGLKLNSENSDGGLYVGLAGVAYMFYHISKIPSSQSVKKEYLEQGLKFIQIPLQLAYQNKLGRHITDKTGFLTGNAGIFAVASVLLKQMDMNEDSGTALKHFIAVKEYLKPLNWFEKGGDELFVGRAGFLCALSWLREELKHEIIPEHEVEELLNTMISSGKQYSQAVRSPIPLMYHYYGTEYLGAAHGLSGILFVMLCFPQWLERHPNQKQLIKISVDSLLQLQTPSGNFPSAMDEVGGRRPVEEELVHWCHGAPGVVYLLAKSYLVFKEQKYLEAALRCGEITWQKGLLKKGSGICHGISGSGYVFILLYQLTKDPKQLKRAQGFNNFLHKPDYFAKARKPDSPLSLYEGIAGTVCFTADLTDPLNASYPFFKV
ncbi:LanC-like protein 3 [Armadillidium vulgare]|nr:LanC-like protein 3 [Armadillidium vulgare]